MEPKLEVHDQAGYTPLHLAIRSVATLKSTRPVRTLLLRGASRQAVNRSKQTCIQMIPDACEDGHKTELTQMLQEPKYLECMMVKQPLVPLNKNHRSQALFFIIFIFILSTQICVIIPSK
jgi:hypothetical protein